jgi:hypothetical protein
MSEEWLDIQGFIADHEVLQAINDLSIGTKLELAGVRDPTIEAGIPAARTILERFLTELDAAAQAVAQDDSRICDRNQRELAQAFQQARSDQSNFGSVLVRSGAKAGAALLGAADKPAKRALVESLDELRRIVSGHQSTTLAAIIEEF